MYNVYVLLLVIVILLLILVGSVYFVGYSNDATRRLFSQNTVQIIHIWMTMREIRHYRHSSDVSPKKGI